MTTNRPPYMVATVTFHGMERQYFNDYTLAMHEYNRLRKFGREVWLYNLTTLILSN